MRELAVRLGGSYRSLHAPAAMASVEACRALTSDPSISAALSLARRSDVALVGVGDPRMGSSAAVVEAMDLGEQDRAAFWAQEPVGDLAGRYLTVQGQPVRGPVDDRAAASVLEDLVRIPLLVGIVSGQAKTEAVLGVLRGRYLDALGATHTWLRAWKPWRKGQGQVYLTCPAYDTSRARPPHRATE